MVDAHSVHVVMEEFERRNHKCKGTWRRGWGEALDALEGTVWLEQKNKNTRFCLNQNMHHGSLLCC